MPFGCGLFTFVRVWSMFSIARYSSYSCRSSAPQYSVPRSVRTRLSGMPCVSKNATTRSLRRAAAVSGVFVSYSFANATLLYVSMKVCW
jgi:hypothetical protein